MTDKEWALVKAMAAGAPQTSVPAGLIVDSPWIPGFCGVDTVDYYMDMHIWRACQEKVRGAFPGLVLFPGDWVEFGMAAEPSSFGCKVRFFHDQTVGIGHLITSADDIALLENLPVPDPRHDGLMPLALRAYQNNREPLERLGRKARMAASRGPLNIAGFLMTIPEFCVAVKIAPDSVHKLLDTTTEAVIRWLEAQMEAMGDCEGILLLDDICGFFSEAEYLEFAHPRLKRIFDWFHVPVKMFHNDNFGNRYVTFPYIRDLGVGIFNFSHQAELGEARRLLGDEVCILGNLPPLGLLTRGEPEAVRAETRALLEAFGAQPGLMLSVGGGASPGMPGENLAAMLDALRDWNGRTTSRG